MYYMLANGRRPRRWIDDSPFIQGLSWWRGTTITMEVPKPLHFTLKRFGHNSSTDHYMGVFIYTNPPLWRDDFIAALRECGVDNFDCYEVAITDPDDGSVHRNYKAVNILGLVAAADMEKSVATVHDGIPLIDVDFDKLVIDEERTHGIKLFRLAESTNTILVHESLRDALVERGFGEDLRFYNLEEVAT